MRTSYEVRSGKRLVSFQSASTASEAFVEYLRSIGCRNDEITRVAIDAATWRGCCLSRSPAWQRLTTKQATSFMRLFLAADESMMDERTNDLQGAESASSGPGEKGALSERMRDLILGFEVEERRQAEGTEDDAHDAGTPAKSRRRTDRTNARESR